VNKDSKIYIAGHRGLVGSAIVDNLKAKGYSNIIGKTHEELDLLDQEAVKIFFETEKPEYVFLAAAKVGGIIANNTYRADFIYENLQIQNNIIHQSYKNNVKKMMFLGSTCIYPKNAPQPMREDCLLTDTLEYTNEPYAIAKIAGIKMCESYNLQYGTNYISVMPTNLYGPNDNFDLEKSHVLPALIRKIHIGKLLESGDLEAVRKDMMGTRAVISDLSLVISEKSSENELLQVLNHYGIKYSNHQSPITNYSRISIEIWGSGKPMREFLWSEDMADACVFIMENRNFSDITQSPITNAPLGNALGVHQSLSNEIRNTHINIGTGVDIAIAELAETIKEIVGFKGELYFNTDKPDGTMKKLTDVSKLHALGWKHSIELEKGIEKMYQWYKGNRV
jgi:GDP-L-fucose synthase